MEGFLEFGEIFLGRDLQVLFAVEGQERAKGLLQSRDWDRSQGKTETTAKPAGGLVPGRRAGRRTAPTLVFLHKFHKFGFERRGIFFLLGLKRKSAC